MRQAGFWKGFVSAFVVMVGLFAVNAMARQGGVQIIDNQARMAEAMIVCAQELRQMNDKGLTVYVQSEKPLKIDKLEVKMPDGVVIKPASGQPIEVKAKTDGQTK